jgi:predicted metal-dependent hydrolase
MFGIGRPAALPEGQWLERGSERFWLPWKPHASAKRLKLLMASDGPRLTLPPRATERAARAFVTEHEAWLWAQWQRHQSRAAAELQLCQPLDLPWFGDRLPVHWRTDQALAVFRETENWRIHVSPRSSVRQLQSALRHEYARIGQAWFGTRMQTYLPQLPKAPSAVRIKPLRTLWGSLAVNDGMNLDTALLFAPEPVAEYVLVHELCHLLQRNHSPKFWREVELRCPDWREHRDYLRSNGPGIKAEARRLFG